MKNLLSSFNIYSKAEPNPPSTKPTQPNLRITVYLSTREPPRSTVDTNMPNNLNLTWNWDRHLIPKGLTSAPILRRGILHSIVFLLSAKSETSRRGATKGRYNIASYEVRLTREIMHDK